VWQHFFLKKMAERRPLMLLKPDAPGSDEILKDLLRFLYKYFPLDAWSIESINPKETHAAAAMKLSDIEKKEVQPLVLTEKEIASFKKEWNMDVHPDTQMSMVFYTSREAKASGSARRATSLAFQKTNIILLGNGARGQETTSANA
jgi:hypothetical protein